jgi:predicted amidohydrolase YtcJ
MYLVLIGALLMTTACATTPKTSVFYNGRITTLSDHTPNASALAVVDGRIAAVGSDAEIRSQFPNPTQAVDLQQKRVVPGFIESHAHFLGVGYAKLSLDLRNTQSEHEAVQRIREKASTLHKGEWVRGRGWDQNDWPSKSFPTHQMLQDAAPHNPVALGRIDGHAMWCNALAMTIAGVDAKTPDPEGGKIIRDEHGNPTGVFIDNAMNLITQHIPKPSRAQDERAAKIAAKGALSLGITSLHDAGSGDNVIDLARDLINQGEALPRLYIMLNGEDRELLARHFIKGPQIDDKITVRSIKFYTDGALGSRGAAMIEPYSDDPTNRGLMLMTKGQLADISYQGIKHGFQIASHAIGDLANRHVLDAYETAIHEIEAPGDLRLRVEHAQLVHPDDVKRFHQLGVIASIQPTHCTSDMPWVPSRLGAERTARDAYPWRSFLDAKVHIAAGSDAPIEAINPMLGLYAATTRRATDGLPPKGWQPEQILTLDEALRAFTIGGAYAEFQEHQKGKLEAGYLADFAVLSNDIFSLAPDAILETNVDMTVLGGNVVYSR